MMELADSFVRWDRQEVVLASASECIHPFMAMHVGFCCLHSHALWDTGFGDSG